MIGVIPEQRLVSSDSCDGSNCSISFSAIPCNVVTRYCVKISATHFGTSDISAVCINAGTVTQLHTYSINDSTIHVATGCNLIPAAMQFNETLNSVMENCIVAYSCPSDLSNEDCLFEFGQDSTFENKVPVRVPFNTLLELMNEGNNNLQTIVRRTNSSLTMQQRSNITAIFVDGTYVRKTFYY